MVNTPIYEIRMAQDACAGIFRSAIDRNFRQLTHAPRGSLQTIELS